MKISVRPLGTLALLAVIGGLLAGCSKEQEEESNQPTDIPADPVSMNPDSLDPIDLAPDFYSVLLEDERVRVLSFELPAGERDVFHYHPHEVGYFVTGGRIRVFAPGGFFNVFDVPDSLARTHGPWLHAQETIGETDVYGIVVEIKDGARDNAGVVPDGMGAPDVAPEVYTVMSVDERARIMEMKLPAGASDREHSHPAEVAFFLKGGKARIHLPDGESMEVEVPDGGLISHEAWTHRVENIGETDIHAIIFELQQTVEAVTADSVGTVETQPAESSTEM
jgi:quercetin dioxygenase-like cupin family protein